MNALIKNSLLIATMLIFTACLMTPTQRATNQRRHPQSMHQMNDLELMMLQEESPLQSPEELEYQQITKARYASQSSLSIGMPKKYVRLNLGSPNQVEVAGHPRYGNERWTYERAVPTLNGYYYEKQRIYFENGSVVGWETK